MPHGAQAFLVGPRGLWPKPFPPSPHATPSAGLSNVSDSKKPLPSARLPLAVGARPSACRLDFRASPFPRHARAGPRGQGSGLVTFVGSHAGAVHTSCSVEALDNGMEVAPARP